MGALVDVGLLVAVAAIGASHWRLRRRVEAERMERLTLRDRVRELEMLEEL